MQLPSIVQLAITGLLASSTVSGFQTPGEAARRAAGAIAILAAPVVANPVSPLALRNDEVTEKHRKKQHQKHHDHPINRRQWGWGGWGDDGDDDGDDDEPSPTTTATPGKGKGAKGKTTGVTSGIKTTIIAPTGKAPTSVAPPATAPPAPNTTLKSKGRPTLPFPHKSVPHETFTPSSRPTGTAPAAPTLKHKNPTHTVTVTLKAKTTAPTVAEPTVTVTVIEGTGKSKGIPFPTPVAPPFGFPGFGDDDN